MGWGEEPSTSGAWGDQKVSEESTGLNAPLASENSDGTTKVVDPQARGWARKENLDYDSLKQRMTSDSLAWGHAGLKYDYVPDEDQDDIGPIHPELEEQLFNTGYRTSSGVNFDRLAEIHVDQEGPEQIRPMWKFDSTIHPIVLETIKKCRYRKPTPVQQYTIPAVLKGGDVVTVAQTGSGKTGAYMIPIISSIMGKAKTLAKPRISSAVYDPKIHAMCAEPLVLILCPTRELALQIFDEARRFCYRSRLRPCVVYGGGPKSHQIAEIQRGCDILIGPPGRVLDILTNSPQWLSLRRLRFTVLDEADEMLKGNWEQDMANLLGGKLAQADAQHQYLLFSATFAKPAREAAENYLESDRLVIKVGRVGTVPDEVVQNVVWVEESMKQQALVDLIGSMPACRTLVFVNSVHRAEQIEDMLHKNDYPVTSMHSNRTQMEREHAINAFKKGVLPIMVVTGVAARGIDVQQVMHIINYDLPSADMGGITEYVHRIGRTGRIGNKGKATSFYNERNEALALPIVKNLMEKKQAIPDFLEDFKPETLVFDENEDDSGMSSSFAGLDLNPGAADDGAAQWGSSDTVAGGEVGGWGSGENNGGGWGAEANGGGSSWS